MDTGKGNSRQIPYSRIPTASGSVDTDQGPREKPEQIAHRPYISDGGILFQNLTPNQKKVVLHAFEHVRWN